PHGARDTQQVPITSGQTEVNIKLQLPTTKSFERYRFELLSGQCRIHVQTLDSKPDEELGRVVLLTLAASLLTHQRYEISYAALPAMELTANPLLIPTR